MKRLSKNFLRLSTLIILTISLIIQDGCSKKGDPEPAVVPPNTQLNSLFDAAFLASQGFQDAGKSTAVADGKQVFVIKDLVGDKELTWANNRTIPSPLWPDVPTYYNDDAGGYILVPNVNETYWASKGFTEMPQPYDVYVVLRDLEAVANEGYFAVGIGLRNRNDHLELKVDSKGVTTAVELDKPTILEFNKRSIVRIRVDGAKSALWINNVQVSPSAVNLGTGGINVLGYGTNSHAAQHDFYGMWVKFGTLNSEEHKFIYTELEKQYKPGTFPDQPFANKIKIIGNAAASPREWSVTYDFVAPAGATEDKTKTEYQWGYYLVDAGQDLNTANYLSGANAKKNTLKRSDFPAELPGPGPGGSAKSYVFVVVKAYDMNGNSWSHIVRSSLFPDNY